MLMTYKASLGPSINKVCVKKGVESKKTEQVKGRVNSDEKTEHTSEEKKKKGKSPDIFLLPHLSVWSLFSLSWLPVASGTQRSQNLKDNSVMCWREVSHRVCRLKKFYLNNFKIQ